jgi:GT2 family glycosyltransferase
VVSPDVSIVIPVYNEEGILREAVTNLLEGLETVRLALAEPSLRFEIIIAENGSRDRTVELAEHLAAESAAGELTPDPHVLPGRAQLWQSAAPRHPRSPR